MNNNEALTARILQWIENARRNINSIQNELRDADPVNPATLAARMNEHYTRIEAWQQVLQVMR